MQIWIGRNKRAPHAPASGIEGEQVEASGVLAAGESSTAMAYIKARRGVSPRQTKLILVTCMLGAGIPVGA